MILLSSFGLFLFQIYFFLRQDRRNSLSRTASSCSLFVFNNEGSTVLCLNKSSFTENPRHHESSKHDNTSITCNPRRITHSYTYASYIKTNTYIKILDRPHKPHQMINNYVVTNIMIFRWLILDVSPNTRGSVGSNCRNDIWTPVSMTSIPSSRFSVTSRKAFMPMLLLLLFKRI